MSKDVFLYELKAYIKFPVVLLGIWLLTAIGCGIAVPVSGDAGAEEAYGIVDGMAQLILYALFLFLFFFHRFVTVKNKSEYEKFFCKCLFIISRYCRYDCLPNE